MRGGALPPALLSAALGFGLSFVPVRTFYPAASVFVATAVATSFLPIPGQWQDGIFLGCWTSVIIVAASVHIARDLVASLALVLATNAGVWAGAVISVAAQPLDLVKSLPLVLIALPGAWLVSSGREIILKVISSWLVAVAILAAALPTTTATPGYVADHME